MLLRLKSTLEEFNCERGIAHALLAVVPPIVEIPPAPTQRPAKAVWSISESLTAGGPVLHCKCQSPHCRAVLCGWGETVAVTQKFRHTCGAGVESAPKEIQEAYAAAYRRSTEEPGPPRRAPGSVSVI
jgi:hypothetical protein